MNEFLNRYKYVIARVSITVILSVIAIYKLGLQSDYTVFVSIVLGLYIVFCVFQMFLQKSYNKCGQNIVCALIVLIFSNHLYSYNVLLYLYEKFLEVDKTKFILYCIGIGSGLLVLFLIIYYIKYFMAFNKAGVVKSNTSNLSEESNNESLAASLSTALGNNTPALTQEQINEQKTTFWKWVRILVTAVVSVIVVITTFYLYFKFNMAEVLANREFVDWTNLISVIGGYLTALFFFIFIICMVFFALGEFIRFLYQRAVTFRKQIQSKSQENTDNQNVDSPNDSLLHIFSVLIVFAMIVLVFNHTDFSVDDFTDIVTKGDYIALPLLVLLGVVTIFFLMRLIYIVLKWIFSLKPDNVLGFFSEQKLDLKERIGEICNLIIEIVLGTLQSALEFVHFIPNFFGAMSGMVLNDDDDEENQEENSGAKDIDSENKG